MRFLWKIQVVLHKQLSSFKQAQGFLINSNTNTPSQVPFREEIKRAYLCAHIFAEICTS